MLAESFHRLTKVLLDSGEAATIEDAVRSFRNYGVRIVLGRSVADDPMAQVIALTAINSASRSFLGNVDVVGSPNMRLLVRGFERTSLGDFLSWLGIEGKSIEPQAAWPTIVVGDTELEQPGNGVLHPWADGWRYGLGQPQVECGGFFPPAGVAAAGLAVSEAFSMLRGDNRYAGRRSVTLSLWFASPVENGQDEPSCITSAPAVWLVGLGHLGQAYAWTLGFMAPHEGAVVFCQDVDRVTESTVSTSLLSTKADMRRSKARLTASWLEARGYETMLVERRFDEYQRVGLGEPQVACFGVDNASARRVIEGAGFRLAADAGLGAGYRDFRAIRVRTFPGPSEASAIWANSDVPGGIESAPAYKALLAAGADPCGVTTLATRAVGAPFVGCVAAAHTIAEVMRNQLGFSTHGYLDLNLRTPQAIEAGCAVQ